MAERTTPLHPTLRGSCFCGLNTYTSSILPTSIGLCHCTTCRKLSGAPFLAYGSFRNSDLHWTSPTFKHEPGVKLTSSHIALRGSCQSCGSQLFMKYHCEPDNTDVTMGTVDEGSIVGDMVRPRSQIFLKEKAKWWDIRGCDGEELCDGFDEVFLERLKRWEDEGSKRREDIQES